MSVRQEIKNYIASHPPLKSADMQTLHDLILGSMPECKLWFLDGKNEEGKIVSNPNIGYGTRTINYAGGKAKEFYQIGLSANTTGISVYIMGLKDKDFLSKTLGDRIGKAKLTGYCIKFKKVSDIHLNVLEGLIRSL